MFSSLVARGSSISRGLPVYTVTKRYEHTIGSIRYDDMYNRLLQTYTGVTGLGGDVSVKDFLAVSEFSCKPQLSTRS